jgi:hypothetical protein
LGESRKGFSRSCSALADITEWIERFRNLNAYAKKRQAEETEGIPRGSPGAVHRGWPEEALDFLQPLQEVAGEWKKLILIDFRIALVSGDGDSRITRDFGLKITVRSLEHFRKSTTERSPLSNKNS